MLAGLFLAGFKAILGPLFSWLNARTESDKQIHIMDTAALTEITGKGMAAIANADDDNTKIRVAQGAWGPMTWFMAAVLAPLVWHEWQVVLDSSRFVPTVDFAWGWLPFPSVDIHIIGTWRVAALPGVWEVTEQAIFTSLFVGASAAVASVAAITAWQRHSRS